MSGLFGELQRTTQALAAQSQGVYTAGRNMANVNNPAFARQRVVLGDKGTTMTAVGPQSLGVEALSLQNVRDQLLDFQVLRETAYMKALEAEADANFKAETALGQQIDRQGDSTFIEGTTSTGSSHGVGEALDSFFNAFNSLASNPRSEAERQALFQQAQTLTTRLNRADSRLAEIQVDIDDQIRADIGRVNGILESLQSLTQQIGRFEVGSPGSALDLRDQRQAKLEELSQYMDFEVQNIPDSAGQIRILSRDSSSNQVEILDSANPFTRIGFNGTSITGGSGSIALSLQGGRLAGHLTGRDGAVADLRTGLDNLAAQLVTAVNGAYNPGGAYSDFFNAAGTSAATIALDPSVTSQNIRSTITSEPGANDIALAVSNLASTRFSTASGGVINGSLSSYYRSLVSDLGNATASANSRLQDQTTLQRLVLERRDAVSGVSLDEEMSNLIKYQRAFDASARVMRTIDEMLEVIIRQLA